MKEKWQAVFFDFDGVVLDSVHVKTGAFAKMFEKYGPEIRNEVIDYHLKNGGVSRMDKFSYFYEHLLKKKLTLERLEDLCREFSRLVVDKVVESDFIPGAFESLQRVREKEIPAYVVSGTPQGEIELIVERKGLAGLFRAVYGSPRKKENVVREIIENCRYDPSHCLFIGDAMSDYHAAAKNGTKFLGIIGPENTKNVFPEGTLISFRVSLSL